MYEECSYCEDYRKGCEVHCNIIKSAKYELEKEKNKKQSRRDSSKKWKPFEED